MPLRAPADARLVAYEVKWDGFRAVVSTEAPLRARSRRGWNMAPQLGFLAELPVRAVLDGEVVAFGSDTKPDFPLICEALLQGRSCSRSSPSTS
jgi:ATP-dependent DNA ligase